MGGRRVELLFDPAAESWGARAQARPLDELARATRERLGLPVDRPVVMGGHQPEFWHAGIGAKLFALGALARRLGWAQAWVVVDQSPGAGATLAYPARAPGLVRRAARLCAHADTASIAPASLPPVGGLAWEALGAASEAREGLARIDRALRARGGEASLARQVHGAMWDLLARFAPARGVFATELPATPAWARMMGTMRTDPAACARLYNEAARAHPRGGVRALGVEAGRVELPVWERAEGGRAWRHVWSDRLGELGDERLVPRGVAMTGLLRWAACDLFVHGTGGGASGGDAGYDRVTEAWLATWLGVKSPAPAVVASATMTMDLGGGAIPSPEEIARAGWAARHASHDPGVVGDRARAERKRELLRRMGESRGRAGGAGRAACFAEMQALLREHREVNRGVLEAAEARARVLRGAAGEASVAFSREWPLALHRVEDVDELAAAVWAAIGGER